MDFPSLSSTGQDDIERRKMLEDAVTSRRWSLIPQVLAGAGDTLSAANAAYGGPGTTGAQNTVNKTVSSNLEDRSKQFEKGLTDSATSDVSKQYQNLLGKFLNKDPQSFAHMTAAQIKEQIPAIEKLSSMENQRDLKKMTMQSQADARKDATANRDLQFKALEVNRQQLNEDRDAKRALQEQQQLEGRVQKHATEIQKQNIPEMVSSYNELQDVFSKGTDVAGIGLLDSQVPGFLLSPEGIRNRTNLQQLANSLLKSRSGAAVSDQEYRRFLLELAAGKVPTEKAIKTHLGKMGQDAKMVIGQLEAGLPPKALEEYQSHPGAVTAKDVADPSALYAKPESAGAVPEVGSTFQGGKVKRVTRIK